MPKPVIDSQASSPSMNDPSNGRMGALTPSRPPPEDPDLPQTAADWLARARATPWTPRTARFAASELANYIRPDRRDGLACHGWPVFPCKADKRPATPHGFKDATNDPDRVDALWIEHPGPLIGLPTGEASGVVVIDLDLRPAQGKDGPAEWTALVKRHGDPGRTCTVRTPIGGVHLYFRHPGPGYEVRNSASKIAPGIDVRGDGGYVIVPPSRCPAGEYRTTDHAEPAELPPWLCGMIATPRGGSERVEPHAPPPPRAPEAMADRQDTTEEQSGREPEGEGARVTSGSQSLRSGAGSGPPTMTPEEVIRAALPKGPGRRNAGVLKLARGLKFDAGMNGRPMSELRPFVEQYHRRAISANRTPFKNTWAEFAAAWDGARMPLSVPILEDAAERARRASPCPAERPDYDATDRLLVRLCRELARLNPGRPFFLDCRSAAAALRLCYDSGKHVGEPNHFAALRLLKMLRADGILEVVKPGDAHNATRYRWRPPID